ncbi:MAG: hypothetical protein AB7G12_07305 [Thermoanaerobaculia bacterium]
MIDFSKFRRAGLATLAALWITGTAFAQRASDLPPGTSEKATVPHVPSTNLGGPANDDCAAATPIASLPFSDTIDTTGATDEGGEPASSCTLSGASVWYSYTNANAVPQFVNVESCGSGFDTVLEVFTGTCGSLVPLALETSCNDDSPGCGSGLQSAIQFSVDPGATVLIRASGFDGDTGQLQLVADGGGGSCDSIEINGTFGSGSPDWPSTSGTQTERLNRDGISATCSRPKLCDIFTNGSFNYEAYSIPNESGTPQCVMVEYELIGGGTCDIQVNAFLGGFDPTNLCANYGADSGFSLTGATTLQTNLEVPAATDLVVVAHAVNQPSIGCQYQLRVIGDVCPQAEPPIIQEVPALDRYGIALLVLLIGAAGLFVVLRRRQGQARTQ